MRARLALLASGTVCELREVALAHKPPELLQASPKGTVPVLVLPEGTVLEQSLDIMLWALRRHDPLGWLPASNPDIQAALDLIAQCDGDFKGHLDYYKYPNRYALPDGLLARALGAGFLSDLNEGLDDRFNGQRYLAGPHFGLADAAIAPFVRQFAHTDLAWFASQPWPALQRWLAAFEASSAYARAMDKTPEWAQGQAPVWFPAP